MLPKEDEKLPFTRHVVCSMKHFDIIKDFIVIVFMWSQKVIISDPECKLIVGAVDVIKAICWSVRSLVSSVC